MVTFRKATAADLPAIAALYEEIHTEEEAGRTSTGWQRGVYPTRDTAATAIALGDMFLAEENDNPVACGRINREQVDVYADVPWEHEATDDQVMVLHTLVVSPTVKGRGYGSAFVSFYEQYALDHNCPVLRIDTNERNTAARSLYKKLGYREAGVAPCVFNGIPGVGLVCLEKRL